MFELRKLNKIEIAKADILEKFYGKISNIFRDHVNHTTNKLDYYQAIPNGESIIKHLLMVRKCFGETPRLLDVGCGKGNILTLAHALGYYSFGLEYRKEYQNDLNQIFCIFTIIDAFDYKHYNKHDVIYAYMPIACPQKMSKLLSVIDSQIESGKMILFYGGCKMPASWKKHKDLYNLYIKS